MRPNGSRGHRSFPSPPSDVAGEGNEGRDEQGEAGWCGHGNKCNRSDGLTCESNRTNLVVENHVAALLPKRTVQC